MNKRQAVIKDIFEVCQYDFTYLHDLIVEFYRNSTDEEMESLFNDLELSDCSDKRQACIQDTIETCQVDLLYLDAIIEEIYSEMSDEEIEVLFNNLDFDFDDKEES